MVLNGGWQFFVGSCRVSAATALLLAGIMTVGSQAQETASHSTGNETQPIRPLAQDYVVLLESPSPANVFCYSPSLARCPNGRLVAAATISGPSKGYWDVAIGAAKVFVSDDHGKTWVHKHDLPRRVGGAKIQSEPRPRLFVAGQALYAHFVLGDMWIVRSDDWGETWTDPVKLTEKGGWHQTPCQVHYANGCVYLALERRVTKNVHGWPVGEFAEVLMRGPVDADLTRPENWTFASELSFRDLIANVETDPEIDFFGLPFFPVPYPFGSDPAPGRRCYPMGWLEGNVVQIANPDHYWYDPKGKTFHIWMRAHTGNTGYAAVVKVVENDDGSMTTMLETVPSGKKCLFVPCPGGQMKFEVTYDEKTERYWLLSTQATDSMTRAKRLPADRFQLPNNERRRLQLHFSKNMIDWCFAGLVAVGPTERSSRNYASMLIDGDDLHFLSRSGDERAMSAHDADVITFHTIKNFRKLVY